MKLITRVPGNRAKPIAAPPDCRPQLMACNESSGNDDLMPPVACVACGYDLRGTRRVGRCPECGEMAAVSVPSGIAEPIALPDAPGRGRLVLPMVLLLLATLLGAWEGFEWRVRFLLCSHCGRTASRETRTWHLPLTQQALFSWSSPVSCDPATCWSRLLDPRGNCAHEWLHDGGSVHRAGCHACGRPPRRDAIQCARGYEFEAFVSDRAAADPGFVSSVRLHLMERRFSKWIERQFAQWRRERRPATPERP